MSDRPIDPNNTNLLYMAYVKGVGMGDTGWVSNKALLSVARAVLPEGYVAVPVWAAQRLCDSIASDEVLDILIGDELISQEKADAVRAVRALLPKDAE